MQERADKWWSRYCFDLNATASRAIYLHMTCQQIDTSDTRFATSYVKTPYHLNDCLQLFAEFPEWKARFPEMANYGPHWAAIVREWEKISTSFLDEVGLGWTKSKLRSSPVTPEASIYHAPCTFAVMQTLFNNLL